MITRILFPNLFALYLVRGSLLKPLSDSTGHQPSSGSLPIPPGKRFDVAFIDQNGPLRHYQAYVIKIVAEKPEDVEFRDGFTALSHEFPLISNQKFLEMISQAFARPFVRMVTVPLASPEVNPPRVPALAPFDLVKSEVEDKSGNLLGIEYEYFIATKLTPKGSFKLWRRDSGPFVIPPPRLKEILDHSTGIDIPLSYAQQIANRLAHNPDLRPFKVEAPLSSEEAVNMGSGDLQTLEFDATEWLEHFDSDIQFLVRFQINNEHVKNAVLVNSSGVRVVIGMSELDSYSTSLINFFAQKKRGTTVKLPASTIARIMHRLGGFHVPMEVARQVARQMAEDPEADNWNVPVYGDLDMAIWQLLSKRGYPSFK